jgi:hypothetical protein
LKSSDGKWEKSVRDPWWQKDRALHLSEKWWLTGANGKWLEFEDLPSGSKLDRSTVRFSPTKGALEDINTVTESVVWTGRVCLHFTDQEIGTLHADKDVLRLVRYGDKNILSDQNGIHVVYKCRRGEPYYVACDQSRTHFFYLEVWMKRSPQVEPWKGLTMAKKDHQYSVDQRYEAMLLKLHGAIRAGTDVNAWNELLKIVEPSETQLFSKCEQKDEKLILHGEGRLCDLLGDMVYEISCADRVYIGQFSVDSGNSAKIVFVPSEMEVWVPLENGWNSLKYVYGGIQITPLDESTKGLFPIDDKAKRYPGISCKFDSDNLVFFNASSTEVQRWTNIQHVIFKSGGARGAQTRLRMFPPLVCACFSIFKLRQSASYATYNSWMRQRAG